MRCNAVALVAVLLAGCAARSDIASALRPADLLSAPAQYDASVVSVYGYMVKEPEAHGLWQSRADFQSSNVRNCVSLLIPDGSEMGGFNGQYVVVSGRFIRRLGADTVHLGACNYPHLQIIGRPMPAPAP